jgi:hypothetical protein
MLDINYDAIVLPAGLNLCNTTNFAVTLNTCSVRGNSSTPYESNLVISNSHQLDSVSRPMLHSRPQHRQRYDYPWPAILPSCIPRDSQSDRWDLACSCSPIQTLPKPAVVSPQLDLIAAAGPSANTGTLTPVSTPSSSASIVDEDSKQRTASIIGGTLGGAFGLALIVWIVFLFFRHRKIARTYSLKCSQTELKLLSRKSTEEHEAYHCGS